MLIELGHFAMILALALAAAQAFFGLAGAYLQRERWLAVVPSAVTGQFLFLALGTFTLMHAFVVNDFSVKYVAEHSNSALPLFYRIAALWGAHEGSLLLWICVLGLWTIAVALCTGHLPRSYAARVLGVLGVVSFGFLLFLLSTSNPFERLIPAAADGNDLNPLLQDFAMAIHPPDPLRGIRGHGRELCLCVRGHARRTHRPRLGALAAAVDHRRLGFPELWHRTRQLVGLLRARLGRLVVLGPGRERLVHALAGRHRADPFAGRHRQARTVQELDAAAVGGGVLAEPARHFPGALRRAGLGAFLRLRPGARHLHPLVPRAR